MTKLSRMKTSSKFAVYLVFLGCNLICHYVLGAERCPNTRMQSDLNSFLWTVRRDPDPPAYLFGTIHVPYTRVWDFVPENAKTAFHRADSVNFELDLTDPYTLSALASCQLLPRGQNLSSVLPPSLFQRLKRHLAYVKKKLPSWVTSGQRKRGLYSDYLFNAIAGNWQRKRPVWVMLMVNLLTRREVRTRGVPVLDLYLAQQAAQLGKRTGSVEQVEEQCIPLNELNVKQVLFALNLTLSAHELHRKSDSTGQNVHSTDDLIRHYNCGDLRSVIYHHDTSQVPTFVNTSLPRAQLDIAQNIDRYFRRELIYRRNERMASRVAQLLRREPKTSFFFAFGAGHFLGNGTVIDKLRKAGYNVQYTPSTENVYLGKGFNKNKRPVFPDVSNDFSLSAAILRGPLDVISPSTITNRKRHRHRHRNHRGRRKHKKDRARVVSAALAPLPTDSHSLQRPNFNDLWIRLEDTSFGPDSYFRRQQSVTAVSHKSATIQTALPNNSAFTSSRCFWFLLLLAFVMV